MFLFFLKNQLQWSNALKVSFDPISQDIWKIIFLSFVINILIICPTWYMLEVYSRVITSKSHITLLMLTILVIGVYILLEAISYVRSLVMQYIARKFENYLGTKVFDSIFLAKLKQQDFSSSQGLTDLRTIQDFLVSAAFTALIDTPIAVIAIAIIFLYDPLLGWLSILGLIILVSIAIYNYKQIHPILNDANKKFINSQRYVNNVIQNAQAVEAMGMLNFIHKKWLNKQHEILTLQSLSSSRAGLSNSISKLTQMMLGSLTLGFGAWLVIEGKLDAGSGEIMVNSMLASRALAPLLLVVSSLRVIISAQDAVKRLDGLLKIFPQSNSPMSLPPPQGNLSVESLTATSPITKKVILQHINFKLPAGNSLAILGPSASGKTTLARLLIGIWAPMTGSVRLDGVDIYHWDKNELGPYLGYLPQDIELFDGTIAENIARFSDADLEKVKQAAKIVGIHDFIMAFDEGYDQSIGNSGSILSGGQRQRIALARAIYGLPKYIVLDEPNSNLDEEGEIALMKAIQYMNAQGSTIIVITHRPKIASIMDYVLVLVDGQMKLFGQASEVLAKLKAPATPSNPIEGSKS